MAVNSSAGAFQIRNEQTQISNPNFQKPSSKFGMRTLRISLIAVLLSCLAAIIFHFAIRSESTGDTTVLHFDEIPTAGGSGTLPAIYHHLSFSKFSIIAPNDHYFDEKIPVEDKVLAVSAPNAIIGSKDGPLFPHTKGAPPAITLNSSVAKIDGIQPWFALKSLKIKSLGAPPPGVSLFARGYKHGSSTNTTFWTQSYPEAFNAPTLLDSQVLTLDWAKLYKVEFWAEFGIDFSDWEFTIDDLEVQFFPIKSTKKMLGDELK
ncbi:MAG: hypothetical protein M1829_003132 [Trizodia sp. TS-e1964]|nr:MAG: hypothetical protein M1829_003132 [Trizodia sp. TS-e1964]